VIVEAVVDPYEPPMPAKITVEQARKFAEALVRGEPARDKIVRAVIKDRIREMI
jgi:pyruvate dehydrogenase (quinone)/pyruvate oxidase